MSPSGIADGYDSALAITYNQYDVKVDEPDVDANGNPIVVETEESFTVPALYYAGKYGVTDNLELHADVWIPFGATIGAKYMVVGDGKEGLIISPGFDIGRLTVGVNDSEVSFTDLYFPVSIGYKPSGGFEIYAEPKYVLRIIGGDEEGTGHIIGANLGIAAGSGTKFLLEGGYFQDTFYDTPVVTGGIGLNF